MGDAFEKMNLNDLNQVTGGDITIRIECNHRGYGFEKLGQLVALDTTIFFQERKCLRCGKVYYAKCEGSESNWTEISENEYNRVMR